jgi:hypothetical protein
MRYSHSLVQTAAANVAAYAAALSSAGLGIYAGAGAAAVYPAAHSSCRIASGMSSHVEQTVAAWRQQQQRGILGAAKLDARRASSGSAHWL